MIDCRTLTDLHTDPRFSHVVTVARRHPRPLPLLVTREQRTALLDAGLAAIRAEGVFAVDVPVVLDGEAPAWLPAPEPPEPPPPTRADLTDAELRRRLRLAIDSNRTYIDNPAPTAAQRNDQLVALTRQVNAVLRLLVHTDLLDDGKAD